MNITAEQLGLNYYSKFCIIILTSILQLAHLVNKIFDDHDGIKS